VFPAVGRDAGTDQTERGGEGFPSLKPTIASVSVGVSSRRFAGCIFRIFSQLVLTIISAKH